MNYIFFLFSMNILHFFPIFFSFFIWAVVFVVIIIINIVVVAIPIYFFYFSDMFERNANGEFFLEIFFLAIIFPSINAYYWKKKQNRKNVILFGPVIDENFNFKLKKKEKIIHNKTIIKRLMSFHCYCYTFWCGLHLKTCNFSITMVYRIWRRALWFVILAYLFVSK